MPKKRSLESWLEEQEERNREDFSIAVEDEEYSPRRKSRYEQYDEYGDEY